MARQRRPAAETREAMLEAAQALLVEGGPASVNLDAVGAAVGVSRQAVLHHFGDRAGLLRAVVERAWTGLFADLATLADGAPVAPAALVDRVDDVARRRGNARLGGWLLLSGEGLPDEVFEGALAALPKGLAARGAASSEQEGAYMLLLMGAALFGDALFGARLRQALALPDGEEERRRFREWLVVRLG